MRKATTDEIGLEERRLMHRLRSMLLAGLLVGGGLLAGLHLMALGFAAHDHSQFARSARLSEAHRLAAGLAWRAHELHAARVPAHRMIARTHLQSAHRALARALGTDIESAAAREALALSARLVEGVPADDRGRLTRRLTRLTSGELGADLRKRVAAARGHAARVHEMERLITLAAAVVAAGLAWLYWRFAITPVFAAIEARSRALSQATREIDRQRLHDALTGLDNRFKLTQSHAGGDPEAPLAVLYLDIDNFKALNANFGRAFGDRVLCHVAAVLGEVAMIGENVARMDADKFVVATSRRVHPAQLEELAVEIMRALERRVTIEGHDLSLGIVIGIAARGSTRDTIDTLLVNSEIACERARKEGGSVYFAAEMSERLTARRRTEHELMQALMRDEIEPFFQPQIEVATGRVVGFEALARWRHADRSVLSPYFFMDIAQDARLSERVTAVMLSKSLPALVSWREAGLTVPRIGLNLTLRELRDRGLHERLLFDLDRAGLSPSDLSIEILESALIEGEGDPALKQVAALSQAGFTIDLDDFGTGHAALANLQTLPVDRIKIDRSFVRDLQLKPELRKVTQAMIDLARGLGITALAEGIETAEERDVLIEFGCDQMQGFALGRPMPASEVPGWMAHRRSGADGLPAVVAA